MPPRSTRTPPPVWGAAQDGPDRWTVTQRLDGNSPGNTIDLRYDFTLDGGQISRLVIAP
ncbi:hypothetical protein ACWDY4_31790 [Streptomyces olivaceoviridis]